MDCEFILSTTNDASGVLHWLNDATEELDKPESVYRGYAPRALAFRELGLPEEYPTHTKMKVHVPLHDGDPFLIKIYTARGKEIGRFAMEVPPVAVWKLVRDVESDEATRVNRDLRYEDPNHISAGSVFGQFAQGRKFIVVRRRNSNIVTIAVGIDVNLPMHSSYSRAPFPKLLGTDAGDLLSRVEVIKAHFRVP